MRLLVLEKNLEDINLPKTKLLEAGFELLSIQDEKTLLNELDKSPNPRMLLLGDTNENSIGLIQYIRGKPQYIYIICIVKSGAIINYFSAGVDDVIRCPVDIEEVYFRLLAGKRIIQDNLQYIVDFTSLESSSEIHILNLKEGLTKADNNSLQLETLLQELIVETETLKIESLLSKPGSLNELSQRSQNLGAEELSNLLKNLLLTRNQYSLSLNFNFNFLQEKLHTVTQRIKEAFENLQEYDYFSSTDKEKDTEPLKGAQILLVEDLAHNRMLVRQILKKSHSEVVEAENGQNAVDIWEGEQNFDLIIMDMNMPIMDGFEATQLIRKKELEQNLSRIPIIALTALAMRGDEEKCIRVGCDGYIPKPVDGLQLKQVCEKLLSNKNSDPQSLDRGLPSLQINKTLLVTKNQTYLFILQKIFTDLGLELIILEQSIETMNKLISDDYDLIILDSIFDLELAYKIKESFPLQHIVLISSSTRKTDQITSQTSENIFTYPFRRKEVESVLQYLSAKLKQAQSRADLLADIRSLKNMKGHVTIEDCIQKADNQLAVWQKAFRKIGGDLVLSHEFNYHGKFGFILADVAGHDIKSGYTASWFAGLVKGVWGHYSNPIELLIYLNNLFAHDSVEEDKRFVCALVLLWDRQRGKLHYANAGIPEGIIVKSDSGKTEVMNWRGVPIGMFPNIDSFDHGVIDFSPGDRLYIATDGILEAIPSEIIVNLSKEKQGQNHKDALAAIVDFVTRSIEINDDLTISLFEAKPLSLPLHGYRESISSSLDEVEKVLSKIKTFVNKNLPDTLDWHMVSIAIREALINAVEHGNGGNEDLPIDIDVEKQDDLLCVKISDSGGGFDIVSVKKRLEQEGDLRIQGRGLELMERIAQSVTHKGGGIKLEFAAEDQNTLSS